MNSKVIVYTIGKILKLEGFLFVIPILFGVYYSEKATISLCIVAFLSVAAGFLLSIKPPEKKSIRAREGLVITGLTWIILSIVGSLPFIFAGAIPSFTDAVFETASGFTTTGASIITDLEAVPRCLLMWRSLTHWIGGMGILMFMLIFIPSSADEMNIMRAESPGPSVEKMVPKVRETALILYSIYFVMTVVLILALVIAGMPFFDSVCLSFGTAGTGGFGVHGDSIAGYSHACQTIITIGMVMFGVNFNLYCLIVMRKFKDILHSEEVISYLVIYFTATILVSIGTFNTLINSLGWDGAAGFDKLSEAIHHSAFQVASIMTTTGYATTDFNLWASMPKAVMVFIMFIGACAGSTGGGLKVSRWILYNKQIYHEIERLIHPNAVTKVRLDGKVVDDKTIRTANVFLMAFVFLFVFSLIIISFDGFDLITSFTAIAATINNIGPGLGEVGPLGGFSNFGILSKWVLIVDMIAGRLELFPILIMLSPNTWRKK
ncbi:trk system potassium uptake protein TrkH [Lachnospiraceae bacterium]|nr:trk system potassium uptake protein TrkH [Lachnospiraceae bacterium]